MNIGQKYTITISVTDQETAVFLGSGGLEVYATPAMVCHMEMAAFKLVQEAGHQSVGTKLDVAHVRACKVGTQVNVTAELTETEGRRLEFYVKAEDSKGLLGEGRHQRFIIDPERFMAKLD